MPSVSNDPAFPRAEVLPCPRSPDAVEAYPTPEQGHAFRDYFDREGFIVIRNAVPAACCESAKSGFLKETWLDKRAYFERHASGKHERHVYTEHGFMKYPIMNLQDISGKRYPQFKQSGLELLTQSRIRQAMSVLFSEPGRIVHTMYFDGNQTTWVHRDGDYFDSEHSGKMIGVWVAAEDIHPDSGRFFVVPTSHLIQVPGERHHPNGPGYKAAMADYVRNGPLDCVAPILKQGDVLLWHSLTIHGSLPTLAAQHSRRSFTAHYVPSSHAFARHLTGHRLLHSITVNDVPILLHGDHHSLMGNLKNAMRTDYPTMYRLIRGVKEALGMAAA
ncbi:MAG: phytanoyl-CoA dioxygenase family protein [Pseudomonadota bacterium]